MHPHFELDITVALQRWLWQLRQNSRAACATAGSDVHLVGEQVHAAVASLSGGSRRSGER